MSKIINNNSIGSKIWVFPDAGLPEVTNGILKAHESLIVLNLNKNKAKIKLSLYFTDKSPVKNIPLEVDGERVKCFRMDNPKDLNDAIIPKKVQYAWVLESNVDIVAQYGRLDTTQSNRAFYTIMGYNNRYVLKRFYAVFHLIRSYSFS